MTNGSIVGATVLAVLVVGSALRPIGRRTPDQRHSGDGNGKGPRRRTDRIERARARRRRRRAPGPDEVASWCDELARDLRGGSTLRHTLTTVIPGDDTTAARTEPLRLALERGRPIVDANATSGDPGPHLHLVLTVIAAASEVGGSAAAAIDRVAATLRQRAADQAERRVQAAQARLSAHVMTAVPLSMLGLLLATDDDVRVVIITPVGATCLVAGLTLNTGGWLWMRHIVEGPS
jgi:Flp pilus assembly protein TadB